MACGSGFSQSGEMMVVRPKAVRGERLRQVRESRGLSQSELARRLGISANQINRYENGVIDPSPHQLMRIARELGVTSDYLLGLVNAEDAHLEVETLTADERKFLEALRAGKLKLLLGMIQQAIPDEEEQADVPGIDVTPNGDTLHTTKRTIPR